MWSRWHRLLTIVTKHRPLLKSRAIKDIIAMNAVGGVRSDKARPRMSGTFSKRLSIMRKITTYDATMGNGVHHRRRRMIGTSGLEGHLDRHLINGKRTSRKPRQRGRVVVVAAAVDL